MYGSPRFPPLGGRFAVAGVDLRLPVTGVRARLLYPTVALVAADAAALMLPYMGAPIDPEGRAQASSLAGLVRFPAWLTSHLADGASGVVAGGAVAPGRFPSLAYSHGFGGNAQMGTRVLAEIASHGAIVLAVEHTDGSASRTLMPDGLTVLRFGDRSNAPGARGAGLALRAAELRGAAAALAGGTDSEALPRDVLAAANPAAAFLGGHSYGAPTALLALRGKAMRIAGVLLHDAALQMSTSAEAPAAPCLFLMSDEYFASPAAREPVAAAARAAPPGSAAFLLRGAAHGNFVDAPYWAPRFVMRGLARLGIPAAGAGDADEVLRVIGETGAAFLRGDDAGAFQGFAGAQPRLQPLALKPRT